MNSHEQQFLEKAIRAYPGQVWFVHPYTRVATKVVVISGGERYGSPTDVAILQDSEQVVELHGVSIADFHVEKSAQEWL